MAQAVDGVRYDFRPGESPLEWFSLEFGDEKADLAIEGLDPTPKDVAFRGFEPVVGPVEAEIGLDGRFAIGELFGLPAGWRGQWVDDDTFVVELQVLARGNDRASFEFTFDDATAEMRLDVVQGEAAVFTADRS
jgi:hypothetical protein